MGICCSKYREGGENFGVFASKAGVYPEKGDFAALVQCPQGCWGSPLPSALPQHPAPCWQPLRSTPATRVARGHPLLSGVIRVDRIDGMFHQAIRGKKKKSNLFQNTKAAAGIN